MAAVVICKDPCIGDLVAALVAELLCVCKLGIKYPPGLLCRYGDLVALLYGSRKVAVVNVDGAGSVNENYTRGNHTGSIGDLGNDALDLNLCALCSVASVCDGHCGVSGFVNGVVLKLNDIRALDLKSAVEVLYRAVKLNGISLDGLIRHVCVINGTVSVLAVVYRDSAGCVLDHHCAVSRICDRVNCSLNVVSALGYLIGCERKSKHFGNGKGGVERGKLGSLGNVAVSLELDNSAVLDLFGVALIILKSTVEKHLVTNYGLLGHSIVTDASVCAVAAVNHDGAGGVLNDHLTVGLALDLLNDTADIISLGGCGVNELLAKCKSLCDGNGRIFYLRFGGSLLGYGGNLFGNFRGGLVGRRLCFVSADFGSGGVVGFCRYLGSLLGSAGSECRKSHNEDQHESNDSLEIHFLFPFDL